MIPRRPPQNSNNEDQWHISNKQQKSQESGIINSQSLENLTLQHDSCSYRPISETRVTSSKKDFTWFYKKQKLAKCLSEMQS